MGTNNTYNIYIDRNMLAGYADGAESLMSSTSNKTYIENEDNKPTDTPDLPDDPSKLRFRGHFTDVSTDGFINELLIHLSGSYEYDPANYKKAITRLIDIVRQLDEMCHEDAMAGVALDNKLIAIKEIIDSKE